MVDDNLKKRTLYLDCYLLPCVVHPGDVHLTCIFLIIVWYNTDVAAAAAAAAAAATYAPNTPSCTTPIPTAQRFNVAIVHDHGTCNSNIKTFGTFGI